MCTTHPFTALLHVARSTVVLGLLSVMTGCDHSVLYPVYDAGAHQEALVKQLSAGDELLPRSISVSGQFVVSAPTGTRAPDKVYPAIFSFVDSYVGRFAASLSDPSDAPAQFNGLTVFVEVGRDASGIPATISCSYLDSDFRALDGTPLAHADGIIVASEFVGKPEDKSACNLALGLE